MKQLAVIFAVLSVTVSQSVAQQSEAETDGRLRELKKAAQSEARIEARFRALEQYLKVAEPDDSISLLIATLNDQSPEVRGFAARKLGKFHPTATAAVPVLLARLNDKRYRTLWISNHFAMQRAVRFDVAEASMNRERTSTYEHD